MAGQQKFTMELDEKLQIIRNHVFGELDENLARMLTDAVAKIEPRLKNPDKVRILVFLNIGGKGTSSGRKILVENIKRPRFYRMAIVGSNPYMRALGAFILVAMGINKLKLFSNERDAIQWLNE
ncbi:MAG TPA: STAS/SEC14 domain-containing protein [Chitinivibrionales bacterium]|nr:STAS/SEC14 domain-containing protein [Chitinivibrionales bacterium]